jgi:Zn-dependent peptidase ImmA (M78 family)
MIRIKKFEGIFPVPLKEIAKELGYKVVYFVDKKDQDISGYVHYGEMTIGLNSKDSDLRQRFTLAHEIGHILNGDGKDGGIELDYRSNMTLNSSDLKEVKANKVAAELLMPSQEFKLKFKEIKNEYYDSVKITIFKLSIYFQASEEACRIRAENLKLI